MNKVRWGLLSTARINRRIIPAIRASRRGEVAAVASRSQETADAYAAQWEIPQTFATYEEMLHSDAIDAVYIGLPNHLHADWTVRALYSGKHVLCEKPFALTLPDVDRMIAAAQETGLALAEAFMYRHHPQTKIAGQWVRDGRLGDVTLVRAIFNFTLGNRGTNFRLAPQEGGGSLWDVGIYPVSLAQFIMGGRPKWVIGYQRLGNTGVDEVFAGQLSYGNGEQGERVAQIASSFRAPFYTSVDIVGTAGRLSLSRPFVGVNDADSKMVFYPADGEPEQVAMGDEYLYQGEIEDMHDAILDGRPNYLTLTESRNHVHTILALYESARQGHIVHL
jgi:predicted dehydrogenase